MGDPELLCGLYRVIRVSEIFGPTIQGEGPLIGKPTVFVRTGGCDYRCDWCDTLYAVLPEHADQWQEMQPDEILDRVKALTEGAPVLISLSGGNPAMHDLEPLIELGKAEGFEFALETQGSLPRDWFDKLDWLFLSPKPPSSGEDIDWAKFDACVAAAQGPRIALKVTVFDDADFAFAQSAAARYPQVPVYLMVGSVAAEATDELMGRYRWLVGKVTDAGWFAATVLVQLHVLAWGNQRGR
ncbi:MAG: 7-carboxy-7-deazaguanine synthase QueE [Alphaproteobacteria bacterium]